MPSARAITLALSCLVIAAVPALSSATEPQAPATPAEIIAYHDSGEFGRDITAKAKAARTFLKRWVRNHPNRKNLRRKPAIVLDIDDTSLSLYACAKAANFVNPTLCAVRTDNPRIAQIQSIYNWAGRNKIARFFITGRPEGLRALTIQNLENSGYRNWAALYLRPNDNHDTSLVPYKSATRRTISQSGYRILANIGDQQSDLTGGYARRTYKLPNPMYFTP